MAVWGNLSRLRKVLSQACFPVQRRRGRGCGQAGAERLEDRRLLSGTPVLEDVQVTSLADNQITVSGVASWGAESEQGVEVYIDLGGDGSAEGWVEMAGAGGAFSQQVSTNGMSGTVNLYVRAEFRDMAQGQETTRWITVPVVLASSGEGPGTGAGSNDRAGGNRGDVGDPGTKMRADGPIGGMQRDGQRQIPPKRGLPYLRDLGPLTGESETVNPNPGQNETPPGQVTGPIGDGELGDATGDTVDNPKVPTNKGATPLLFLNDVRVELMQNNWLRCCGQIENAGNRNLTLRLAGATGNDSVNIGDADSFDRMFRWHCLTTNQVTIVAVDELGNQSNVATAVIV